MSFGAAMAEAAGLHAFFVLVTVFVVGIVAGAAFGAFVTKLFLC